jgi:hypothetical protein
MLRPLLVGNAVALISRMRRTCRSAAANRVGAHPRQTRGSRPASRKCAMFPDCGKAVSFSLFPRAAKHLGDGDNCYPEPLRTHIAPPMPDDCSERPSAIHAPAFGDDPEMLITLRCGGLNSGTRYRPRTRWHNHRSTGVTLSNCTINVVSVVSPIAGEWSDWTRRSIEQRPDLRAVIDIVRGQLRRDDFTRVGVRARSNLRQERRVLVNLSRVQPSGVVRCRTMHGSQHRSLRADRQRGQFDTLRENAPTPFHR